MPGLCTHSQSGKLKKRATKRAGGRKAIELSRGPKRCIAVILLGLVS